MASSESIHICPSVIAPCNPVSTYVDDYLVFQICYYSTLPTSESMTPILAALLVLTTKTDYLHSKRVLSRSAFQATSYVDFGYYLLWHCDETRLYFHTHRIQSFKEGRKIEGIDYDAHGVL
ncbi:hypothetical protein ACTXT7_001339, partial [Hymenolepis weldensis]